MSFLSMNGRVNRAHYLGYIFLIQFGFIFFAALLGSLQLSDDTAGVLVLPGFFFTIYLLAVQIVRRLHDLDRPGFHYFLLIVPLYNIYLAFVLLFDKGTEGANRYGADPLVAN